jgi:hypothetical protein
MAAARAALQGAPDAAEQQAAAQAFGLALEMPAPAAVPVWPDCWAAVQCFCGMATQWRMGVNGATGLDYAVLPVVLRLQRVPRADWAEVFEGLRVMEAEALRCLDRRREGKAA